MIRWGLFVALLLMDSLSIAHAEMTPAERDLAGAIQRLELNVSQGTIGMGMIRVYVDAALHERDAEVEALKAQVKTLTEQAAKACPPKEEGKPQ